MTTSFSHTKKKEKRKIRKTKQNKKHKLHNKHVYNTSRSEIIGLDSLHESTALKTKNAAKIMEKSDLWRATALEWVAYLFLNDTPKLEKKKKICSLYIAYYFISSKYFSISQSFFPF